MNIAMHYCGEDNDNGYNSPEDLSVSMVLCNDWLDSHFNISKIKISPFDHGFFYSKTFTRTITSHK